MYFALPSGGSLNYIPNPKNIFCLDLRNIIDWFQNRKMKKNLKAFNI